ncbi:MAG: ABC transporter permease, partial [Ferruginibacter sp.]|nr:ABC transporter permease [Cytophagales bacterium]
DPHSILLSASTARALFGEADPLGKLVRINADLDAKVTGVYEDLPRNTAFHEVKFLAPFDLWVSVNAWVKEQQWDNWFLEIYAQLPPGADGRRSDFDRVSAIIKDAELNQIRNLDGRQEQVARQPQIYLLPMDKWHLYGGYDLDDQGPVRMVWLVGLIGVFVLLLACINFMNLSTARSQKRAKEVGVRKAIGSGRGQLVRQFLTESFLVVMLAFGLALWLATYSLPWFNDLAAKQMRMPWANAYFWLISLGCILLTGFVAGSYPAFYLSSFQPVKVLKGTFRVGRLATVPRQVLVVVQFTVSVTLTISTLIVYRQIEHAKNRPVGYSREGLLLMEKKTADFNGKHEVLRSELQRTGVVYEVAQSRSSTTNMKGYNGGFSWKGKDLTPKHNPNPATQSVTAEYGKTVGWQFVAGRDFSRERTTDSSGLVINESFAKRMGLKNPVGEVVTWAPGWRKAQVFTILGVIKDMVVHSPYEPTIPMVFFLEDGYGWINIRLNPMVSTAEALPKIEAIFKKVVPSTPFDYQFADQGYSLKFASEERIGKLATFFASLAILISCLGLFGLASFTAEQRTKEIGIRKVLGATVVNLWQLLCNDFIYLITIAFVIAAPTAHYFLSGWLRNYEYRTEISWWIFAASGAGALVVTLLTVSYQAVKAALANPVKSLRTE